MKTRAKLKWFTLIEMLIVMVIIGILAVVLTESYITISKMALKIEQEKNISEESLMLTQIFQSISDEATIDYDEYTGSLNNDSYWFTWILYLTWEQRSWTKIYSTWNCLDLDQSIRIDENGNQIGDIREYTWCSLVLEKEWEITPLLSTNWKVIPSKVMFKIIPYDSDTNYFDNPNATNVIRNLHQPWFRVFIHLYAPLYQPTWTNKIDEPLQLFFNLNV